MDGARQWRGLSAVQARDRAEAVARGEDGARVRNAEAWHVNHRIRWS